jgi:hypothetical protein
VADNDRPDSIAQGFITDDVKAATEYLHDLLHPDQAGPLENNPDPLIRNYAYLTREMRDAVTTNNTETNNPKLTENDFLARLGNGPDGKPYTMDSLHDQFAKLASERFRKITDPHYDLTQNSLANDINMMNTYLLLAEKDPRQFMRSNDPAAKNTPLKENDIFDHLAPGFKPDYTKLTNTDGSKVLNPDTRNPYTADNMVNLQAAIEAKEFRALLQRKDALDAKYSSLTGTGLTPEYYQQDGDLRNAVHDSFSNMIFGSEGLPDPDKITALMEYAKFSKHEDGTPYRISKRDIHKLLAKGEETNVPIYVDMEARDILAVTRALHLIEDNKPGATLPGSATQPAPTPTTKPVDKTNDKTPGG